MKPDKIVIKNSEGCEDEISGGTNTEVYFNGKKLEGVMGLSFKVQVGEPSIIKMELYANIEVEGNFNKEQLSLKCDCCNNEKNIKKN